MTSEAPAPKATALESDVDGWIVLPPEKLPAPSIWPAALAMAITLLVWGLVTSLIITGVGILLFAAAMAGWIRDIRHERSQS